MNTHTMREADERQVRGKLQEEAHRGKSQERHRKADEKGLRGTRHVKDVSSKTDETDSEKEATERQFPQHSQLLEVEAATMEVEAAAVQLEAAVVGVEAAAVEAAGMGSGLQLGYGSRWWRERNTGRVRHRVPERRVVERVEGETEAE